MSAPLFADPTVLPEPGPFPDPSVLVDPGMILAPPEPDHRLRLAIELAAAFLVCVHLTRNYLADASPKNIPRRIAAAAWKQVMPVWLNLAGAAIRHTLLESGAGATPEVVAQIANDYAQTIGDYIGTSSVDAFEHGVDAQLAERFSDTAAVTRASAGFGLDANGLASFLKTASTSTTELVSDAAQALGDAALLVRAELIGDSEAANATETGQLLIWQRRQRDGDLPADTQREWHTAVEEDQCPLCGPLNHTRAGLDDPFRVGEVELWAPQVHPNCRCHVELIEPVGKAYNPNQPRNPKGSQGGGEFTKRPAPVREAPARDPVVDAMMAEARAAETEVAEPEQDTDMFDAPGVDMFDTAATDMFDTPVQVVAPTTTNMFDTASTNMFDTPAAAAPSDMFDGPTGLRVYDRDVTVVPAPPSPGVGQAFYLPTSRFLDHWAGRDSVAMLGNAAKPNFGPYNLAVGERPYIATPAHSDWAAVTDADLSAGRVGGKWAQRGEASQYVPVLADDQVASMWDVMRPDLERGRNRAIAEAVDVDDPEPDLSRRRGIVQQLDPRDAETIAQLAGFTGYSSTQELKDAIKNATLDMGSGHDGLADAYADYVVFNRNDLLGRIGETISTHLEVARLSGVYLDTGINQVEQVMKFRARYPGLHPTTVITDQGAELEGHYRVGSIRYHSALAEHIHRPLAIGLQVITMEPFTPAGGLARRGIAT